MTLEPFVGPWPLFQFFVFYTVVRIPGLADQPVARRLTAHRMVQTQNKRTQTFMSQVGFESNIPVFERAKTVHALNSAATVGGNNKSLFLGGCTDGQRSMQ
jgi:hypothetical protein